MLQDIAVFLAEDGESLEMGLSGKIVVYHRQSDTWDIQKQQHFLPVEKPTLLAIRNKMRELIDFLGDCKVFVAKSVTGVYYYELEKAGVSVWEYSGKPEEFLDHIAAGEEAEPEAAPAPVAVLVPSDLGEGRYFVSIKEIQENNSGITSKQVLQPFLRQGKFYSLEILCNHLPPWLEGELAGGSLAGEVIKLNDKEVKVIITRTSCL